MSKRKGLLLTILSAIIYGIYPSAAKKVYAHGGNDIFVMVVSTFFRAAAMIAVARLHGKAVLPAPDRRRALVSAGFFQAMSIFCIIASLVYLPPPVTLIIFFTHTLLLLLYMAYRDEIALTKLAVGTVLTALFGISLVVDLWGNLYGLELRGIILALIAALAATSRLYLFEREVRGADPIVVGGQILSVAFLFTVLAALLRTPVAPSDFEGYLWLALCCLSFVIGSFAMFNAIALVGSFQYSLTLKLEPMFTALFSILILGEYLSAVQYFGMAVVIISLVVFQMYDPTRAPSS